MVLLLPILRFELLPLGVAWTRGDQDRPSSSSTALSSTTFLPGLFIQQRPRTFVSLSQDAAAARFPRCTGSWKNGAHVGCGARSSSW